MGPDRWADNKTAVNEAQDNRLEVVPDAPSWPAALEAELGTLALRIDRHGSTAIPGLGAKPLIHIQVISRRVQLLAAYGERLQGIGGMKGKTLTFSAGRLPRPGRRPRKCPRLSAGRTAASCG
jgi:GrpB-like predicted nucleotidyltransferase (UPF0157 family)